MSLQLLRFPVGPFGSRIHFYDGFDVDRAHSRLAHHAIDISTASGNPVVAATGGLVVQQWIAKKTRQPVIGCGWSPAGGNIVLILDGRGYVHYYAHMNGPPLVSPGAPVIPGTPLGYVGNTGSIAQGSHPHLHYQVWVVGPGRAEESGTGVFRRIFGRSENPYRQLVTLARGMGARVGENGGVFIPG
jgi:murein DD-endopeptidase MepM/ murein hydrolase activator NlpD